MNAINPELWWGFALETGSTFRFTKGPSRVPQGLNTLVGADPGFEVTFRPVPNMSTIRRAALGRSISASALRSAGWTIDRLVTTICSDLQRLYRALEGSLTPVR